MAKTTAPKSPKTAKEPGRLRQLWRYYRMTAKESPRSVVAAVGFALAAFAIIFVVGAVLSAGNVLSLTAWGVTGFFVAVLIGMIVMNRQSEKIAFGQIEGRAGAVGAILQNGLKRGWRTSEYPAAINAAHQEAVYRVVGPGGVVLIGEGTSRTRVTVMVEGEKRKIAKVATGVPIEVLYVVGDEQSLSLIKLVSTIYKMKRSLRAAEVSIVFKRLETVGLKMPIPKGIDPNRMRASRR